MTKYVEHGWFTEAELPFSENQIQIKVKISKCLYDKQSKFAHIQVFDTPFYGKMLVIDGVIQTTVKDEFIYHEMMVVLPSVLHGDVRNVLIVGGGDGGAAYQATRFSEIESITQVEIDDEITKVTQTYMPEVAKNAYADSRVNLAYTDGEKYIRDSKQRFDLIVLDLTDPVPGGPAELLFEKNFLLACKDKLSPNGMIMMQCGSLLFQPNEVKRQVKRFKQLFDCNSQLYTAVVPGYQLTTFGFLLGSVSSIPKLNAATLMSRLTSLNGTTKYLNKDILLSASSLPPYLQEKLLAK